MIPATYGLFHRTAEERGPNTRPWEETDLRGDDPDDLRARFATRGLDWQEVEIRLVPFEAPDPPRCEPCGSMNLRRSLDGAQEFCRDCGAQRWLKETKSCEHLNVVPDGNGNGRCPDCGVDTFSTKPFRCSAWYITNAWHRNADPLSLPSHAIRCGLLQGHDGGHVRADDGPRHDPRYGKIEIDLPDQLAKELAPFLPNDEPSRIWESDALALDLEFVLAVHKKGLEPVPRLIVFFSATVSYDIYGTEETESFMRAWKAYRGSR